MENSLSIGLRKCINKIDFKPKTQQPGPLQLNSTLFPSTVNWQNFFFLLLQTYSLSSIDR